MDALFIILNDQVNFDSQRSFAIKKKHNLKFENTLNQGIVCLISVTKKSLTILNCLGNPVQQYVTYDCLSIWFLSRMGQCTKIDFQHNLDMSNFQLVTLKINNYYDSWGKRHIYVYIFKQFQFLYFLVIFIPYDCTTCHF